MVIWDDSLQKVVGSLEFYSQIIDLKVVGKWAAVVLSDKVIVLDVT